MKKLIETSKDITILLDTSEDLSKTHQMLVYFAFGEKTSFKLHFYRLIQLGMFLDAESMFTELITKFIEDKIESYMRANIRAYVSDGTNVMLSKKETSVYLKIKEWIGRDIPGFHCSNHKFELVIKYTLAENKMVETIGNFMENLISYFTAHLNKRLHFMKNIAISLDQPFYSFRRLFNKID